MKKQIKNSISAIIYQIVAIGVGLIIPRLMIGTYGSATNGLASSLAQFLSYITLLEGGIGGVARASLYKAFAEKDNTKVSSILKSVERFFMRIAAVFVIYIILLAIVYPRFINNSFDPVFTGSLVVIIAISTLVQYCFGITYSIFLQADQKSYVSNTIQIITLSLNAILTISLIRAGATFHVVKMMSAVVFLFRPLCFNVYVRRHYSLDKQAESYKNALTQRWNGLVHHIAWFLHTNTDIVIITIFGNLFDVSIYSIYYYIASSVTKISTAIVNGSEALFGNMMANEAADRVQIKFSYYTMIMNMIVIIMFGTAASVLMPFITLYAEGISDADYYVPILGFSLLAAEAVYCFRIPYHSIITAKGHFKETQVSALIETILNIVLSIILICKYGLPGVAIATLVAMMYRTIYYVWYLSMNILHINVWLYYFRLGGSLGFIFVLSYIFNICGVNQPNGYLQWILQTIAVGGAAFSCAVAYGLIFYKREFVQLYKMVKKSLGVYK